ncbi:MAG TPA: C25 family cysteine peptidase [Candidatus Polarisedimenticolaceae bacterium]|nr:C25 family cysteine peptidase [Candidatus Polarisedimenticolaceae bacterium]
MPFHVVRVAIPEGTTPRLILGAAREDTMPGTMPRPVPRVSAQLDPETDLTAPVGDGPRVRRDTVLEPDATIFQGHDPFPAAIARLGDVGTFRNQRYVDVVVTPVRFDPRIRGLRVARSFQVTVAFDGDEGARSAPALDPLAEDQYRSMFANYAQGTTFRTGTAPEAMAMAAAPAAPLAGPRYKVKVRAYGIVRLDFTKLNGTGFETQPISTYKLTERGNEIPILVNDVNGNDQLDSGDWIEFYGQPLDDEPKTILNTEFPGGTNIYEARDFTDENAYYLTAEAGARARLATRSAPPDLSAPATKFDAVQHLETDNAFRPLGGADPWYWSPSESNPAVVGPPAASITRTVSVPLPGLATTTDPAEVLVRLRGLTEDTTASDHKTRITLKNASSATLATNNDDGTFDGRMVYTHDFTWTYPGSGAALSDPAQVTIDALAVAGSAGYKNQIILDFIEIHYKRSFQATGDALTFDWPDGDTEIQVTGLATNAPEVWEVTGRVGASANASPVKITGGTVGGAAGNFSVRFHIANDPSIPDGTPRRFVVAGANAIAVPAAADFASDPPTTLRDPSNQADLIVIAHPTPLGATSTATLNSLLSWKLANQGLTSKVVMIQDVYDEFGDGLVTPQAIKSFMAYAMASWSGRKPAFVLLIGDGSYDYKYNDTSVPLSSYVPTQILFKDDPAFGYYASDSILMDVTGTDTTPDLVVGRISTRSDAQTNIVLQKILAYEQNPPTGNWRRHALFVSDRGKNYDVNEAADFEATNDLAKSHMKIPPHTARTLRYWTDYCNQNPSSCQPESLRSDIKKALNGTDGISDGASIMQYVGHGNFNVWSDDAFFAEGWPPPPNAIFDVNGLVNATKQPWLIAHNCLTGGFEDTNDVTLGEDFLKRSGGGAIAVFAPSGLTDGYQTQDISDQMFEDLFGKYKERMLGNAVAVGTNFACQLGAAQACQNYVLLGDPSTRLIFPAVNPATALVAAAGNAVVNLTWTASTTAGAKYDVYRAVGAIPGYTKIASLLTTTSFSDTTVTNAKSYLYYVVAEDTSGFESRWSNFNSDCAVNGPDCVQATPLNPGSPAAPTGLTVTDPETGGKLNLSWAANLESDFDHYTVWWGTAPGTYTFSGSAGKATSYTLTSLTNGTTYYVAITASNTSGHTSGYSGEQQGTPTFVRGVRSPEFISGLHVDKSGTSAVLTWPAVTTDIYGKAETVANYEVYRGTTPDFIPGPGNRIATPTAATFTDTGILADANNYYWLVRAVDTSGNVGGLGNQLPNGIDVLTLSKTPDGSGGYNLGLSWPAVTTDFDGNPLAIQHYEVYASDHPFTRTDVKNGTVPLLGSPTSPSFSVTAPAASQYYSVLAVDARGNKSPF